MSKIDIARAHAPVFVRSAPSPREGPDVTWHRDDTVGRTT
jgi:hypothetical protein